MSRMMVRRQIPLAIMFLIGVILVANWFIPNDALKVGESLLKDWNIIILAFAIGVGAVSLYRAHYRYIVRRTPGQWQYSVVVLVVTTLFVIIGLGLGPSSTSYRWMYSSVILPLGGAVFASVAFYISSAAYRAMRISSWEASFFLISGLILLMRNAPIGRVIWIGFPILGDWIQSVITTGVFRAFKIGIGLGAIITGIRTIMGMETTWLGRREDE